jgi:hypothetical protein
MEARDYDLRSELRNQIRTMKRRNAENDRASSAPAKSKTSIVPAVKSPSSVEVKKATSEVRSGTSFLVASRFVVSFRGFLSARINTEDYSSFFSFFVAVEQRHRSVAEHSRISPATREPVETVQLRQVPKPNAVTKCVILSSEPNYFLS